MDLLTKALLEDLLDTQKTVAIYGGGFKPPTKGHFNVAELALKQFPEIDELKIFVGQGIRDGVTQDESIRIWDIYKNYLSPKVDVEASVAPVKSVLGYAKENPDTKVYWILGARDGDEGDLADIKNRTKSLDKYPNLEVKVITTSGGVSGTKTRQAVRDNNKEQFFHLIPSVSEEEKQQIWDLVSPVIKEDVRDDKVNKELTPDDITRILKRTGEEQDLYVKDWDEFTPELCNDGFCDIFAEKFKEDDERAKQTIEARNNFENLVYQFKVTLSDEKIASQIDESLKEKLTSIINENVKWLEHNHNASKEECDYRLKNFQEAMKPLQEKMMYGAGTDTGVPSTASKEPDIADID